MARLRKNAAKLQKRVDRINELRRARAQGPDGKHPGFLSETSIGYEPGALVYSRDGKTIYQVQRDGSQRIYRDATGKQITQLPEEFQRVKREEAARGSQAQG